MGKNHRNFLVGLLLAGGILAASADRAGAWGGHDVVMQAVVERLPGRFRENLSDEAVRKAIGPWSHYPDSFDGFDADW